VGSKECLAKSSPGRRRGDPVEEGATNAKGARTTIEGIESGNRLARATTLRQILQALEKMPKLLEIKEHRLGPA